MRNNEGIIPFPVASVYESIKPGRKSIGRDHASLFILLIFLTMSMVSCSPFIKDEQPIQTGFIPLQSEATLGQTFVAHYDGLTAIDIYMQGEGITGGKVTLKIFNDPTESNNFDKAIVQSGGLKDLEYYRLAFTPQARSNNKSYYFSLETNSPGQLLIGNAAGNTYLNGSLYSNSEPQDGQITFRLAYNPWQAALGLLRTASIWLGYLLVSVFLYILPGWQLLHWLLPSWKSRLFEEKVALSAGVSLAMYPLLLLWTDLLGFQRGLVYGLLLPFIGILVLLVQGIREKWWSKITRVHIKGIPSHLRQSISTSNLPFCSLFSF